MKIKTFVLGYIQNNVYLVEQDGNCILIDPTFDENDTVAKYIEQNSLHLQAILLTHGHFDHCGGVKRLVDKFGVEVYCRQEDAELASQANHNRWGMPSDSCTVTKYLVEGINHIGAFDIEVMFTSGHTQGGACFIIGNNLFSGDTLFCRSVGRTDLPGGDSAVLANSLSKLCRLEKDYTVYAGHGESTTLAQEKILNPFLQNL